MFETIHDFIEFHSEKSKLIIARAFFSGLSGIKVFGY